MNDLLGKLAGEVAFITGGASGVGFGMAQAFAAAGMKLAVADIDEERAAEAAASLGGRALGFTLDVRNRDQWTVAVQRCERLLGPIHILCNNAGVTSHDPLIEMAAEDWDWLISINLTGVWNGVHACGARVAARGTGHIVNTASTAGLHVPRNATVGAYSASKAAVIALSEALRLELASSGIGVSVLCAGPVNPRIRETAAKLRPAPSLRVRPAPSGAAAGIDPRKVGERVMIGILRNEQYIITHPEMRDGLERRFSDLLDCYREAADPG